MKLLGWMHQKLRQKSSETFKDSPIGKSHACHSGNPILQDYPVKPTFGSRYCSESLVELETEYEKSFPEFKANRLEKTFEEETPLVFSESFRGFLSIGTLGSEPVINEPETPTFKISLDEATNVKTEVTENDLKLISYELEKFLDAEAKEEGCHESSGRNSHVSIITLGGKEIEGVDTEDHGKLVVCPLQEYLFGSPIELPETGNEVKKEKASLAELFQRTKISDENPEDAEIQKKKTQKTSMSLMKKMVKKLNDSTKSFSHSTGAVSAPKNKLKKALRMLHRKIHPESSVAAGDFDKSRRNKNESILHNYHCSSMHPNEDSRSPRGSVNNFNLPQYKFDGSVKSKTREHWIRTDADYLVLEL